MIHFDFFFSEESFDFFDFIFTFPGELEFAEFVVSPSRSSTPAPKTPPEP